MKCLLDMSSRIVKECFVLYIEMIFQVLRTDAFGTATFGYTTDLETANTMGCSVRLNIEQDELGGQFFTEADNVRYNIAEQQVCNVECSSAWSRDFYHSGLGPITELKRQKFYQLII